MQEVHFCSGSVFVTGDAIAGAVLRYVQAVAATGRSDVLVVPTVGPAGPGAVTLMVNAVSQISAESRVLDGPELVDEALVSRLEALTRDLTTTTVWFGEDDTAA